MNIMILGYSESGKSAAADMLAEKLNMSAINTSDIIMQDFADSNNLDVDYVVANKKDLRDDLYQFGREKQAKDPSYPVSKGLENHNIIVGVRNKDEIKASKHLFDHILWIDRASANRNTTDQIGPEDSTETISNNGSLEDLRRLLNSWVFRNAF